MSLKNIQSHILNMKLARLAQSHGRPLKELRDEAMKERERASPHLLRNAIARPDRLSVIAEIKRSSPWQNVIRPETELAELALAYSKSGAAAISVWTEEDYFRGSLDDLKVVRAAAALPVLRKDFIIESSQVYETAIGGADGLLLIAAALDDERLDLLRRITEVELGLDALIEVQNANEMSRAYAAGATLIGVNNRNPSTFEVSLDVSVEVARAAPEDALLVSEYGLSTKKHLRGLHALGYKGVLIEESQMGDANPDKILRELL
ncbi:MAG TPA: indole-3-glycerol-phosphate synthase [Blastocatellia bacterium]|nr:indole-3-glycerol-phosphate synthase [Blastocatellia bacterium]